MNTSTVLDISKTQPFPLSNGTDGVMFGASLFAVTAISLLLLMRLIATGSQLIADSGRKNMQALLSFRVMIVLICISGLVTRAPEAAYKIAWGEVESETLYTILSIKEWGNTIAFWAVMSWLAVHSYFEPSWTLRLANPNNRVWGGNRSQLYRFISIVSLTALFAAAVAFYKSYI